MSWERENEPNTILTAPPSLSGPDVSRSTPSWCRTVSSPAATGSSGSAITSRRAASYWDWDNPFTQVSGTEHPSQAAARSRTAVNVGTTWSSVLSDRLLQEVRVGFSHFDWKNLLALPSMATTPNYVFPGLVVGQRRNYPQEFFQNTYSVRYDLTMNRGRHDLKIGGEYLRWHDTGQWQLLSRGEFIFTANPPDLARRFPADAWDDPSRWDLSGLDSIASAL